MTLRLLLPALLLAAPLAAPPAAAQVGPDAVALASGDAAPAPRRASDDSLVLQAVRAESDVRLDGRLDEPAWLAAPAAGGFRQTEPAPGAAASFPTEVRVLYTSEALYIGARMVDPAPDSVVARLFRRDANEYSDLFYVQVDSYDDRRTAFVFVVNPRGVQRDYLIYDDSRADYDWDAVWDAATAVDSAGWTAEVRIPLSQLRFRAEAGDQTWGINFLRRVARLGETDSWSPLSREDGRIVSLFGRLQGLRGLRPAAGLEVLPYVASRLAREPGDPADPFYSENALGADVGGDLRYRLTPGLTLSATVNPDFAQVEADPSEVNLTAFETFFPEKRPFFLEGTDAFRTLGPRLFYSRRIGRAPQAYVPGARYVDAPESSTIVGATKLAGRAGPWTLGALSAYTAEGRARYVDADGVEGRAPVEPGTAYLAARARRTLGGERTSVGGLLTAVRRFGLDQTAPLGALRESALAGGVDVVHRFGVHEVVASAYGSTVAGSPEAIAATQASSGHYFQRPDAGHLSFDPSRTSLAGYSATAALSRLRGQWTYAVAGVAQSPGFEINDIGYLRRADEASVEASVTHTRSNPGGPFRSVVATLYQSGGWTFGGERTLLRVAPQVTAQLQNLWSGSLGAGFYAPALDVAALRGGPGLRTDGRASVSGSVQTDPRRPFQVGLGAQYLSGLGTRDAQAYVQAGVVYRPSTQTSLSFEVPLLLDRNADQFVARRTVGDAPVYVVGEVFQRSLALTARADVAFSPDLSLQLYAQPFVAAGRYSRFQAVRDPHAPSFADRFDPLADRLSYDADQGAYLVDADDDGAADYGFGRPDFSFADLRSNVVLRWQYRPGSTLYAVWSRGQTAVAPDGTFRPFGDAVDLLGTDARDVFLLKLNLWLGL